MDEKYCCARREADLVVRDGEGMEGDGARGSLSGGVGGVRGVSGGFEDFGVDVLI